MPSFILGMNAKLYRGADDAAKQAARFESSLWGSGAAMVEQADNLLYEMLDAV